MKISYIYIYYPHKYIHHTYLIDEMCYVFNPPFLLLPFYRVKRNMYIKFLKSDRLSLGIPKISTTKSYKMIL